SLGKLWSMNHFFFNSKLKRILLFSCAAKSKLSSPAIGPMRPPARAGKMSGSGSSINVGDDDGEYDLYGEMSDSGGSDAGDWSDDSGAETDYEIEDDQGGGIVNAAMLDWEGLESDVFLPDCPWIGGGGGGGSGSGGAGNSSFSGG